MAVNPVHVIDFSFLEEDDEIELPSQTRIRRPSAAWRSTTVPHLAATDVDFSVNENEDIPDNPYDPSFTVDLSFLDDDARAETRVYPTVGFHEPCIRSFTEPTPPPPPMSNGSESTHPSSVPTSPSWSVEVNPDDEPRYPSMWPRSDVWGAHMGGITGRLWCTRLVRDEDMSDGDEEDVDNLSTSENFRNHRVYYQPARKSSATTGGSGATRDGGRYHALWSNNAIWGYAPSYEGRDLSPLVDSDVTETKTECRPSAGMPPSRGWLDFAALDELVHLDDWNGEEARQQAPEDRTDMDGGEVLSQPPMTTNALGLVITPF